MAVLRFRSGLILTTFLVFALIADGCKKNPPDPTATVSFTIHHYAGNEQIGMDTIRYTNAAGNPYSVTRLEYFLSDFQLVRDDGNIFYDNGVYYVNARKQNTQTITLKDIPEGNYGQIIFHVGIPASQNISYSLPPTEDNINMSWPGNMGGGYHFMKFEGHFLTPDQKEEGFAVHLGGSSYLVTDSIHYNLNLNSPDVALQLNMDLNQWFENPYLFDFNSQGNYTMGIDTLMLKIALNGHNAFSIKE